MTENQKEACGICSDVVEERSWVALYGCTHGVHLDCLENWFFNQCTTMYQSSRENSETHRDVNQRPIPLMACLDAAPSCPSCRTVWAPNVHTVEPAMKGDVSNQVLNAVLKIGVVKRLEAEIEKEAEKTAAENDDMEIFVDEATERCSLCLLCWVCLHGLSFCPALILFMFAVPPTI